MRQIDSIRLGATLVASAVLTLSTSVHGEAAPTEALAPATASELISPTAGTRDGPRPLISASPSTAVEAPAEILPIAEKAAGTPEAPDASIEVESLPILQG
jgi:hypothetical protein